MNCNLMQFVDMDVAFGPKAPLPANNNSVIIADDPYRKYPIMEDLNHNSFDAVGPVFEYSYYVPPANPGPTGYWGQTLNEQVFQRPWAEQILIVGGALFVLAILLDGITGRELIQL